MAHQQQQQQNRETAQSPETTFRNGAIGGSIWRQAASDGGHFYTFTLNRSWKSDESGKSGYSGNFSERNVDELHNVIDACVNWIRSQETQDGQGAD